MPVCHLNMNGNWLQTSGVPGERSGPGYRFGSQHIVSAMTNNSEGPEFYPVCKGPSQPAAPPGRWHKTGDSGVMERGLCNSQQQPQCLPLSAPVP